MTKIDIPDFSTKEELFKFLVKNKESLIAQKKSIIKHTDSIGFVTRSYDKDDAIKELGSINLGALQELKVVAVMNTTNLIDSHKDMHYPGLWKKTLQENKMLMHLQEHAMKFDKIIADGKDLKAKVQKMSWVELGFDYEGDTQALLFFSKVKKERNPLMFDQYGKGYVRNHSVGMRYVKIIMAIDNENYGAEFEAWEKYYPHVANKEKADADGYFWIVKEAKLSEGSAVPLGSNIATPTLEVKNEPGTPTQKNIKPSNDTIDYDYLQKNFKLT